MEKRGTRTNEANNGKNGNLFEGANGISRQIKGTSFEGASSMRSLARGDHL